MQISKNKTSITVRKSTALFVLRVILLELLFEFIYLSWRGIVHFLPFSFETIITINAISIIIFLLLVTVLQNIILVYIALTWVNDYYEVGNDEIIHVNGIISKTEKAYPYRDIQSITMHQGFLGRLLNYGSVILYIPTLGHDLNFNEISNPVKFIELIKNANPKNDSGRFIFKR